MKHIIKLRLPALLASGVALFGQAMPRPRIVGVPNVAVKVHALAASRHFYKDFLNYSEPFSSKAGGKVTSTFIKINDRQYVELVPENTPEEPRFMHVAIETDNAEALRQYLKSKGYRVSGNAASKGMIGNISTMLDDPDGNHIEVVQYAAGSETMNDVGKDMPADRISKRLLHAGFYVSKRETAHYFMDILGFREFWRATSDGKTADTVTVMVPEGCDYVELMMGPAPTTAARYGSMFHIALEVPDMDAVVAKLNASPARKDYTREIAIHVGRNHKRLCNLFDPDGMRVELTEDHTIDGLPSPVVDLPMNAK
jgi:catechol 2,3-dioxygenase-like lactoylglutathione lyase family enzyme